jgi:hypothetical protein
MLSRRSRFERAIRERELSLRAQETALCVVPPERPIGGGDIPPPTRGTACECNFCGRKFPNYPHMLNHRCSEEI